MHSYIATFPAGCYTIIARQLKQFSVNELKILSYDESAVTFATTLQPERLIEMRFFTNTFLILETDKLTFCKPYLKGSSYRLLALMQGGTAQLEGTKKSLLAELIEKNLGLKANVSKISNDFVLIKRGDSQEMLTLRLPRARHKREKLPTGALRPELAHILLLVGGVRAKDTLLDPFAGYGSVLIEAKRGFGLRKVIGVEKDAALVRGGKVDLLHGDAADLRFIENSSVDRIVTDPPWGIYDSSGSDWSKLYGKSLQEMSRVLRVGGIAVVLSGSEILASAVQSADDVKVLKAYPILVSGKKATIFKLQNK